MIEVYDFDKTLTYDDTTMIFLFYCCNSLKMKNIKKLMVLLFAVLHKLNIFSNDTFKSLSYGLVFKGKKEYEIIDMSKAFVANRSDIFNLLGKRVREGLGRQQYIVTASPEYYVQMYFKNMTVIGTTFSFDMDGVFKGLKFNCFGLQKVVALKARGILEVDQFFTDSYTDRPVMQISKKTYLVKRDDIRVL
ncbi:haloacid dehalogenase-like hydrolase [Amylibacter sp.]|jgi:hypothetical protein|nr:haloacid dehalogenase-like hydrolase [Amylibacter sp.]